MIHKIIKKKWSCLFLVLLLFHSSCTSDNRKPCTFSLVEPTPYSSFSNSSAQSGVPDNLEVAAIFVQGEYAYLGHGDKFVVFDVSNPSHPLYVSSLSLPSVVEFIQVIGNYAFVSNGDWPRGSHIIDISNPQRPIEVECKEGGVLSVINADFSGGYAYVPQQEDGSLKVYDLTSTGKAVEVTSYQPYVPSQISLFPKPKILSPQPMTVADVIVVDQFAYVAENLWGGDSYYDGRISIIDVSNPEKPKPVSVYNVPNRESVEQVFANNGYLFVSNKEEGIFSTLILDISSPTDPREINRFGGSEVLLTVDGTYAYFIVVMNGFATMRVRDLSSPTAPVEIDWDISNYGWLFGWTGEMVVTENYAYFLEAKSLRIVDITNPFAPVIVSVADLTFD